MTRLIALWRVLPSERRTTALVSLGLFVSMLLPWYSKTDTLVVRDTAKATEQSLSAFQAFSFVEAAVLLVSAGVLALLFARAEGRDFQLPGGDGAIVTIAGGWAAILIFYRMLDKPGLQGNQKVTSAVGVEWGIFIALLLALGLAYSGRRIRAGERAEPPLRRPDRGTGRGPAGEAAQRSAGRFADDYLDDEDLTEQRGTAALREPLSAAKGLLGSPGRQAERDRAGDRGPEGTRGESRERPRYPPAPSRRGAPPAEQLSFEDSQHHEE